jgi:hypothetical protein
MNCSHLPYKNRISDAFPNNRRILAFEGAILAAENENMFYLIIDERTMAGFLQPEDYDLIEKLVTVYEFETEEERLQYMHEHYETRMRKSPK